MKITKLRGRDKKLYYVEVMKKIDDRVSHDVHDNDDHNYGKATNFI